MRMIQKHFFHLPLAALESSRTPLLARAADAPNLASTLNQRAFNFGNATGAWIGGLSLTAGAAYAQLPCIGAALAIMAYVLALLSSGIERQGHRIDVHALAAHGSFP